MFALRPCLLLCALLTSAPLAVAGAGESAPRELIESVHDNVIIHCPDELELRTIVDYCGKTLGVRFLYGEELTNQRVQLRPSPIELPRDQLLTLLASLLRVRDLAMVEESPGFFRIIRAEQSTRSVPTILPIDAALDADSLRMVTQVLTVPSGRVEGLSDHLARYMSSPKGSIIPVPQKGLIIVTDYESRVSILNELLQILDVAQADVEVRIVELARGDPAVVAAQVTTILADSHRMREAAGLPPVARGDIVPGRVVIVGQPHQIAAAQRLIRELTPVGETLETRAYDLRYIGIDRARALIDHVVLAPGSGLQPPQAVYPDKAAGRLFVTADGDTQSAIAELLKEEDRALPALQRPLRIYRPRNRGATELLGTLTQLLGDGSLATHAQSAMLGATPGTRTSAARRGQPARGAATSRPVQVPPQPPNGDEAHGGPANQANSLRRIQGSDYILTVDEHTNAILAIGSREFHAQLETLIDDLDRRRPQVLIEVTLVAVTQSDTMDLGIEFEALDLGDAWDFLLFTEFGLSSIDLVTGGRVLEPGVGANGVLMGPEQVPVIMRALATHGNARVLSTARLLVSDNARGTLRNVDEAPFTSVNASDTVATTSFAGFESAGTTFSVTPHILEGDHLTLEYELNFSNFTGAAGSAGVPPPRTTNSFTSVVDVPDGYTVATGGLVVNSESDSVSEVPFVGRIPGLGLLFQSSSKQKTKTKVFAFIRPVILRDDRFAALKFITLKQVEQAELQGDQPPPGQPLWMR